MKQFLFPKRNRNFWMIFCYLESDSGKKKLKKHHHYKINKSIDSLST